MLRLVIFFATAALVGCGSGSDAKPSPATDATASPSQSPTSTVAASPAPSEITPSTDRHFQIRAIQQLTDRIGWVVVYEPPGSALWKTRDGGTSWTRLTVPPFTRIDRVRFANELEGWALAVVVRDQPEIGCAQASTAAPCRSVVLSTGDGGVTWREVLSVTMEPGGPEALGDLNVVDATHAWVRAQAAPCFHDGCPQEIRATSDGGLTWRVVYGPLQEHMPANVRVVDRSVAWLIAQKWLRFGEVVFRTTDGGASWQQVRETDGAVGIEALGERDAWILIEDRDSCGINDCARYEMLRTRDAGVTWTTLGDPKSAAVCSGGRLKEPVFASAEVGYIPIDGGSGRADMPGGVMVTTDGGSAWTCLSTPPNVTLVSAADRSHAWAAGLGRRIPGDMALYATSDAGATWTPVDTSALR